ncbi:MAG: YhcH/YjgK/YiaL family protein [Spirochaetaceae bacterium]|jgi:YhcH/YjgK/YiaL family protein|nr:YhcH/YjgK/YiaL family protein [Spirochaetaceae bacterium]
MFASNILFVEKYDYMNEKFKLAYEFLRRDDLTELPVGEIKLSPDVTVRVQEYTTKLPEEAKFESHNKMIDIQYVASGQEFFGLARREQLETIVPYSDEKDITFYRDPPVYGSVLLQAGDFIVVSPEDAHKPSCVVGTPAPVKKLLIKVRI